MPETPFECAVRKIGGDSAVAKLFEISRQAVRNARTNNPHRCPDGWALRLSEASGVSKSKLRPDVYPPRRRRS